MQVVKERLWPPIARISRSRAAWFFAAVWLLAIGVLALRGFGDRAAGAPVILAPILFFCWLTVLLTRDPPQPDVSLVPPRPRLLLQTASVIAIAALFGIFALVRPLSFSVPLWISNPLVELLVPLVVLLALGARPRDVGFGPGHRVGRVLLLWCVLQLVNVLSFSGAVHPAQLVVTFIRNGFQNGPVEEFLFRGALQTRLSLLAGAGWGLVLTSVLFGVWHFGANSRFETHGDLLAAVCVGITNQTPYGLALGIIFQRTRNLLAGSVFHMVVDLP